MESLLVIVIILIKLAVHADLLLHMPRSYCLKVHSSYVRACCKLIKTLRLVVNVLVVLGDTVTVVVQRYRGGVNVKKKKKISWYQLKKERYRGYLGSTEIERNNSNCNMVFVV